MTAPNAATRTRVENAVALAGLLQRAERRELALSADQYRKLVEQLTHALDDDLPERALGMILDAYPTAAELYENMHYAQSGLSRAPLEQSVQSELLASALLQRLRNGAR